MLNRIAFSVQYEQARTIARFDRRLGDQILWKLVVVIADQYRIG